MKSRILLLFCIFLGLWGLLLARAARLQIFPDVRLENLKRRQFETSLEIHTRRGAILDRNGNELAASIPSYSLFADPKLITNTTELSKRLGKIIAINPKDLKKRIHDHERRFVWLRRQLPEKMKHDIEALGEPGLGFIEEPKRVYPNGSLLAQALGFVGSEGNGLEGLEMEYDKSLRGQLKQVLLPRDARGRPLSDARSLTEVPDGADLELTVDHEIQFQLERELQNVVDKYGAQGAVGVVLDAQTSEIQAMATVPVVDLNENTHMPPEQRRNRVVTDAFEPGSVMKTFAIAGALKEDILKPSTRYNCEGGHLKVGDKWIKEAEAHDKFEWLTVTEILAKSSNVGAAKIAFDLGDERLMRALNDFGFGQKTGVDLPGEARGIINSLPWRPHLLANIAFGHGIAVTPLQVAAAYAAIANGGILKKPLLVKAIHTHSGDLPQEFQAEEIRRVLSPSQASTMRLMLTAATEDSGTGATARIPGYFVAGKTGTAQKVDTVHGGYMKNAYVSSFAGFVPANNPRYVIYVVVDNPRKSYYGGQVAAPVFARLSQYLVRRVGLPPVQISEHNVILSDAEIDRTHAQAAALKDLKRETENTQHGGFPNLVGLSLREAMARVHTEASQLDIHGYGVVTRTIPQAGAMIDPKSRVTLFLDNP